MGTFWGLWGLLMVERTEFNVKLQSQVRSHDPALHRARGRHHWYRLNSTFALVNHTGLDVQNIQPLVLLFAVVNLQ